jgi:hypothetical protein
MNQSGAEVIDTNMSGRNSTSMSAEFQLGRHLNANVKNIVFHASLSAPPGEELSNDKWRDFARDYLSGMGFTDNQYIVVRHHEPEQKKKHDHAHVHIVASRVKLTGECVSDSWDYQRSNILMKELEQKYDLVQTPHHLSNQKERRNARKGEMRVLYKQQQEFDEGRSTQPAQPSARMKLQALIDQFTAQPTTMTDLIDKLQSTGVEVRIRQTRNKVIQGISFAHPDWEQGLKGSDLGSHYTWSGLQTHKSVSYNPVRDAAVMATSAINSRASTSQKIAEKLKQAEVTDGIAGTVTAESSRASARLGDTDATSRSNTRVERGSSQFEYSASQPAAADNQSDPGKLRLEAAVSQLNRSTSDFSRRLEQVDRDSRKQGDDLPERSLGAALIGAGSKSRATSSTDSDSGTTDSDSSKKESTTQTLSTIKLPIADFSDPPIPAVGDSRVGVRKRPVIHRDRLQLAAELDKVRKKLESDIGQAKPEAVHTGVKLDRDIRPTGATASDSRKHLASMLEQINRINSELAFSVNQLDAGIRREVSPPPTGDLAATGASLGESGNADSIKHRPNSSTGASLSIDPIDVQRANIIAAILRPTLRRAIETGKAIHYPSGCEGIESQYYRITYQKETQTLSLSAKDGRGELLRYSNGVLELARAIKNEDVDYWDGLAAEQKRLTLQGKNRHLGGFNQGR